MIWIPLQRRWKSWDGKKGDDGIYERNGQKFHFTIQVRDYEEERVDIANVMSDMLKQAGVEMEVKACYQI